MQHNINDMKLLSTISETCDMARDSMIQVLKKAEGDLHASLHDQFELYDKFYWEADELMGQFGAKPKDAPAIAKLNAHISTAMQTWAADDEQSKIAELVIQGSTMGITKLTKELNNYDGDSHEIKALANRLLKMEEKNIDRLKKFL